MLPKLKFISVEGQSRPTRGTVCMHPHKPHPPPLASVVSSPGLCSRRLGLSCNTSSTHHHSIGECGGGQPLGWGRDHVLRGPCQASQFRARSQVCMHSKAVPHRIEYLLTHPTEMCRTCQIIPLIFSQGTVALLGHPHVRAKLERSSPHQRTDLSLQAKSCVEFWSCPC